MRLLNVGLNDFSVAPGHLHSAMAEDARQRKFTATVAKVAKRERVPETMGIDVSYTGPLAQAFQHSAYREAIYAILSCVVQKKWIVRIGVRTGSQVTPDSLAEPLADGNDALFGPFAKDLDAIVSQIDVFDAQAA